MSAQQDMEVPAWLPADLTHSARPPGLAETLIEDSLFLPQTDGDGSHVAVPDVQTLRLPEPYQLSEMIGSGGLGEVFAARQVALDRTVAVKRPKIGGGGSSQVESDMRRHQVFLREAFIGARLDHPNIVPVHDLATDDQDRPMLVMKLVRGTPWSDALKQDAHLSVAQRLARHLPTLITVAQAIAFAHSRGVVHRDIKPGQVMLGRYGEVYLMDWGLGVVLDQRPLDGNRSTVLQPTDPHAVPNPAGTVAYMAPEQTDATGARIGPWTDIFLLGGTLYQLLTNTTPYQAATATEAFVQAARGEVQHPAERAPDEELPEELVDLCLRCMKKDFGERLPSATEFVQALQAHREVVARRGEACALAQEVRARLEQTTGGYDDLVKCDISIARVIALWPEHPHGQRLQNLVLTRFVEAALAVGDFELARFQLTRLQDPLEGKKLHALLAEAEIACEKKSRAKALRWTSQAAAAAVGAAVASLAWWLLFS